MKHLIFLIVIISFLFPTMLVSADEHLVSQQLIQME